MPPKFIKLNVSASWPLSKKDHSAHSMTALSLARTRYARARTFLATFKLSECDDLTNAEREGRTSSTVWDGKPTRLA
jgi:hypothetical protein